MKLFLDFCPEIFCSFLGASWKLVGLPWDLISNIMNKEAYKSPQEATKKSGQKSRNNFIAILGQTNFS